MASPLLSSIMQQRHGMLILLVITIVIVLALNLHPVFNCPKCHQLPCPDPPKPIEPATPNEPAKPDEPEKPNDPLKVLPEREKNLMEKALKTDYGTIWMAPAEVNMLLRYIHQADTYLEWGSGGSTKNFPRWASKAFSIEHDEKWCAKMKAALAEDKELQHIDYRCVPIARGTKGWGLRGAMEEGSYKAFKPYVDEISKTGVETFGFVLIDGRARVDCAIKALSYITKDSIVVLHDAMRIWGGSYSQVLQYYSLVNYIGGDGKQGIAVMKRRAEFHSLQGDHDAVQRILEEKYPEMRSNQTAKAK